MSQTNFKCSQQELYTIAEHGWNSFEQQLPAFAAFKAKYTTQFIADRLAEIQAAILLPDDQMRGEQAETARILLSEKANACLSLWRKLRFYLEDAYPEHLQKPKLDAAGFPYYARAAQYNWDSIQSLLNAATAFMLSNLGELTASQNMPESFPATFAEAKAAFENKRREFTESTKQAKLKTSQKQAANNELYSKLMKMFQEGQELFKDDEPLRRHFVFDQVLAAVSGTKPAGVKGYVTSRAGGEPLAGAKITVLGTSKTGSTDDEGRYEILQVAAGLYSIRVEKPGFQPVTINNHEVKSGITGKLDLTLAPAA